MDSLLQTIQSKLTPGKKHLDIYNYKTKANLEFKLSVLSSVFMISMGFLLVFQNFVKMKCVKPRMHFKKCQGPSLLTPFLHVFLSIHWERARLSFREQACPFTPWIRTSLEAQTGYTQAPFSRQLPKNQSDLNNLWGFDVLGFFLFLLFLMQLRVLSVTYN